MHYAFKEDVISFRLCGLSLLWKDFLLGGSMLEHSLTLHLVVQGLKYRTGGWCLICSGFGGAHHWPQWLQGLVETSVYLGSGGSGPGRQWWWLKLVVYTNSAAGASCRCLCSCKCWFQTYTNKYGQGPAARVWADCRYTGSCGGPWLSAFITVAARSHHGCTALEAGIGHQAGGVQVPSWRGSFRWAWWCRSVAGERPWCVLWVQGLPRSMYGSGGWSWGSGWERACAEWRRPVTRKRARFRPTGSCEGLGCWPAIPYWRILP